MTVIVCDAVEGVMMADTMISQDDEKSASIIKIFRAKDGALVGAAGVITRCRDFTNWATGTRKRKPKAEWFDGTAGLILLPSRHILCYEGVTPFELNSTFSAIGCGSGAALAARFVGASLKDCILAAIHVNAKCGGDITTLKLVH